MLTFSEGLEGLKLGSKIRRSCWDSDCFLILIEQGDPRYQERRAGMVRIDDQNIKRLYSYIALCTPDLFMPWSATHVDMLEEDWLMV